MTIPKTIAAWTCALSATLGLVPAWSTPILGAAQSFAILGASAVTNTGATTLHGDLGVYPGTSVTGLDTLILTGTVHATDALAQQAHADALTADLFLNSQSPTASLTGQDLGGLTLVPGTYRFASAAQLTGTLTLDAQDDPAARYVFQIGTSLTTASASRVNVLNGRAGTSVFWDVGSSATFGTGTLFSGNVLASQSITFDPGAAILCGRALALHGAVTMDANTVSNDCAAAGNLGSGRSDFGSLGFSGADTGPDNRVPEPPTLWLVGFGFMALGCRKMRSTPWHSPASCG